MSVGTAAPVVPTPAEFVETCRRKGIRLRVVGDKIKASGPPPARPDAFAAYLRAQKPALLEVLRPGARSTLPAPETAPAAEMPSPAATKPVQAPIPALGTDVPPNVEKTALVDCVSVVEFTPPAWSEAPPVAELVSLDASLSWPAVPADSPERTRQWAVRTIVHMAAQGRNAEDLADFAEGFDLDPDVVIARAVRRVAESGLTF